MLYYRKNQTKSKDIRRRKLSLTFIIAMMLTFLFSYSISAQANEIHLSVKNVSLKTFLDKIEEQSDYTFSYRDVVLENKKDVTINVSGQSVDALLYKVLAERGLQYKIEGNSILITPAMVVFQVSKRISGIVTDPSGEPVIGANVVEKGTTNGTITNIDGEYSLEVPQGAILLVSYIGYTPKEIAVGSQSTIHITLAEDLQSLEEVVVVGYGVQKKVNLTGSISVLDEKAIANRPLTNSSQALQGVQGLYVNQAGAQPGKDGATIRIRGTGTLNNNDPLILVNGVPSTLDDVNPNDIASISVLKDAASSAIYGSRAANGVILVTTKTGKKDEFTVQYNNIFGVQKVTYLPDAVWDPIVFMQGWNTAYRNEGKADLYSAETIEEYRQGMSTNPYIYPATNWFDIAFKDAFTQEHNVRISGGTEKLLMSLSVGYLDQDGVLIGTDQKKLSVNFSGTATIGNLKAGINVSGTYRNFNEPHLTASTFMNYTMRSLPVFTQYLEDGSYGRSWLTTPGQNTFYNLSGHVNEGMNNHKQTRMLGSLFAEYQFPFNIKYNITLSANKFDEINKVLTPIVVTYQPKTMEHQNSTSERTSKSYSYNDIDPSVNQTLTWNDTFGKHDLSALLGMGYEEFNKYNFNASVQGFLDNSLIDINAGSKNYAADGAGSVIKLLSYFGRINYSYDNRYLLEANFRYDGSSRFAPKNRWGLFPSFSLGWRLDQEHFMQDKDWLSNLKIRLSWGQLGNQRIGTTTTDLGIYKYVGTIDLGQNYIFGTTVGSGGAIKTAVDSDITWETTTITNAAVDFGFLNNSLSGTIEVFKKRTKDILRTVNIPGQIGNLNGPVRNIGTVDNTGFEIGLAYRNSFQDFNYNVYGNLTYIKNEVIDIKGQEIISGRHITKEGHPIDAFYLYICDGVFQSEEEIANHATQSHNTAPGDLKYRDVDGDGAITEKDRVVTGSVMPDLTYSFGVNLDYKGFGLNVFFQGVTGVSTYPTANLAQPYNNGAGVTYEWLERAWTEDNRNGGFPRLMTANSGHDNFSKNSTFWLKDASYLRLKNVQLSYTFNSKVLEKIKINGLRVFLNGENLLTFSDFKIFDPEKTLKGTNLYQYPSVKSFSGGLNVTF